MGAEGFEKEHFKVSMQVGQLVLLPAVRSAPADTILAAPVTSCRHQNKNGTGCIAQHPAEILHDALVGFDWFVARSALGSTCSPRLHSNLSRKD